MLQYDINPFGGIKPETNVEYNERSNVISPVSIHKYSYSLPFALASSEKY